MTSGERFLVDTNILVYAYDRSEHRKQGRALEVLDQLAQVDSGVLSTQVLGEFFRVVTRKIPAPMSLEEARQHLHEYVRSWNVVSVTPDIVLESARAAAEYQLPYYDAQIWATAGAYRISTVLTEDFSHGIRLEGVQFLNPFLKPLPEEE
jgi:predicted nucleic acid-binding protein